MAAEYRLAFGTITKAALEANANYLLENFPIQSDQSLNIPWPLPSDQGSTYPHYARYYTTADMNQRGDGFTEFQWTLPYLTEGMVAYLEETGALYTNAWAGSLSTAVTVKTLCKDGQFRVYTANALLPVLEGQHFRRGYYGVEDYLIRFMKGVQITV